MALFDGLMSTLLAIAAIMWGVAAIAVAMRSRGDEKVSWHHALEGRAGVFTVLVVIGVLVGGVAEIIPMVISVPESIRTTKNVPYTPLELEGRDVFLREGCYTCHSQMIRPFTWETARYGDVSTMDDSIFDHPFQWGSRRIGPDLARVGGKYADVWHYKHMIDPREISPGSNMPPYPHLATETIDFAGSAAKLRAMRNVGVPYAPEEIQTAEQDAQGAASAIAAGLARDAGVKVCEAPSDGCELVVNSRLVALIAYLQRLGKVPEGEALAAATEEAGQ
jgi:cytochrome c oxidase cbb3-type subunit I/II